MKRTKIDIELNRFPEALHPWLKGADLYDSSSSEQASVWLLDRENGLYLKNSAKGTLETEANMTRYFHSKGLSAQVVAYVQQDADWLLTERIPGEDCTSRQYLDDPRRLSELTGQLLRMLHEQSTEGCPIPDRTQTYLAATRHNYAAGKYDASLFPDNWGYASAGEAWKAVQEFGPLLRRDVLLHGDYCLPNLLLDNWCFSGFIDLGNGGVGDRHIDLFWGLWSLGFNLKTDAWSDRFLDAYGRDVIEPEILRAIGAFEVFG